MSCFVGHTVLLFHAWWRKEKKKERKASHNFALGVRCLIAALLRALPIYRKTVCVTFYILKASLHAVIAFGGKTAMAQACGLWATGREKILLSERSSSGDCQTLSFPAWASAHGPLSLPRWWDPVIPHSLPASLPQGWLPCLQRHLIHSKDVDSIISWPWIWLRVHLTIAFLTGASFIWLRHRGKLVHLLDLCFRPRIAWNLYSTKFFWRPICIWTRVSTFDFLNRDFSSDNSLLLLCLYMYDQLRAKIFKFLVSFKKKEIIRTDEVCISWQCQPRNKKENKPGRIVICLFS